MHYRLCFVGKQLQHIQQAMCAVIRDRANAMEALHTGVQHLFFDARRIEEKVIININDSIRLWVPRSHCAGSNLSQVVGIVENKLGVEPSAPPAAIVIVAGTFSQVGGRAGRAVSQATNVELAHKVAVYTRFVQPGRVDITIPIFCAGAFGPGKQNGRFSRRRCDPGTTFPLIRVLLVV